MEKYWAERNVAVVDTYEISKRIKSYDGRHYGFGLNKLKIQLILLEILDYYSEYRRLNQSVHISVWLMMMMKLGYGPADKNLIKIKN